MDHFNKMSRDDLRKEVSRILDIMSDGRTSRRTLDSQQVRSMKKQELLNFVETNLTIATAQQSSHEVKINEVSNFDDLIFSEYKETRRGVVRNTTYKNNNEDSNFEEYFNLFDKRGVDYYLIIITNKLNSFFEKNETFVVNDIRRDENMNDLIVNVFECNEKYETKNKNITRLRPSRRITKDDSKIINLFYHEDERGNSHYSLIKNLNKLLNQHGDHQKFFCVRCHSYYYNKLEYLRHIEDCGRNTPVEHKLSNKMFTKFENISKTQKHRYVIYADFESIIEKYLGAHNDPNTSWTADVGKHVPSGFCVIVVDSFDKKLHSIKSYIGYNAALEFNKYIVEISRHIMNLPAIKMINLTQKEWNDFNESVKCPICNIEYSSSDMNTTKFQLYLPLLESNKNKVEEKMFEIRFLDSFSFMASSLDKLSENMSSDLFHISKIYYSQQEIFEFLRRKGVYPYEYMDSFKRFEEKRLPTIEYFRDQLNGKSCETKDYLYAELVWKKMNCENMRDYTNVYLVNDVLLLADVFENFRDLSLKVYELDPCWYYTSPGLAWDAMLKKTGVSLEVLKDVEKYLMIEKGIRGGMVNAVKRYSKANNKYNLELYNSEIKSNYLMYYDANNLYGWAMCQKLPNGGFEFENDAIIENLNDEKGSIHNNCKDNNSKGITFEESVRTSPSSENNNVCIKKYIECLKKHGKGCIFEVDLEYPEEMHKRHNDFPLCPENVKIDTQSVKKLCNTLTDKEQYVIHYENLLQCLQLGLKLKKIHRIITFKESNWLAPYIELNTNLRKKAKNDFEKDFFKLMNNSVFGKTMENVRERVDVRLITDKDKIVKLASKHNFKRTIMYNKDLVAVEMEKTNIVLDKPIYVGFAILDLSKYLMYNFHYNIMQKKYGYENVQLCYQDTDSLIYDIKTEDVYEDMEEFRSHFDFSDYPKGHVLFSEENKKVVGKFKDEINGKIMTELVALKPKQYAYKVLDSEEPEKKKCKGIKKCIVKNDLKVDDYKDCLFNKTVIRKQQYNIRSVKHQLYTQCQNKVALNNDEFQVEHKRCIINDSHSTMAYGNVWITKEISPLSNHVVQGGTAASLLSRCAVFLVRDVRVSMETADRIFDDICALNTKTETTCLNLFQSAKKIVLIVNDNLFPRKKANISRALSCFHLFKICEDEDAFGNKLPPQKWGCPSCHSMFNMTISLLKVPIEDLNTSAADFFCSGASEECRSEFKKIVELVGAFGKIFRGKMPIEKVCENIMACK
uniref:DNA-directed DNA polymerase n=1 Tax=Heterorhabditis bacteriophora TaxID=37862 RepID=A0A1I7X6A5_HETBA